MMNAAQQTQLSGREPEARLPHCGEMQGLLDRGMYSAQMSDEVFRRLSEFIHSSCGIKLPPAKKTMLEGRLRKRLRVLSMPSYDTYCEYLFSSCDSRSEYIHMIDLVTTNKTDFFREPEHFNYLTRKALPDLAGRHGPGVRRTLHLWSAACSTGEEPYTLAMVLSEFAEGCPEIRFSVLATDISATVLQKARAGVYSHEKVDPIPQPLRKKYLLRSKDKDAGLVKINPELRSMVRFARLNLMEDAYGIDEPIAVLFCRNVLIYFDRPTQEKLLGRLVRCLLPGGYLFLGHAESIHNMDLPLVQTATSVYRRK